jgi:uncharacterized membrane protein YqjE
MMPVFILVVFAALTTLAILCVIVLIEAKDEDRLIAAAIGVLVTLALGAGLVEYVLKHPELMAVGSVSAREAP